MNSNVSDLSSLIHLRSLTDVMTYKQQTKYDNILIGVLSAKVDQVIFDYCIMTALEFYFRSDQQAYKHFLQIKWNNIATAAKVTAKFYCHHFNIDTEHEPGPTCPICEVTYLMEPLYDQLLGTIECPRLS